MRFHLLAIVAIALLVVVPISAEDEKKTGWSSTAEVGVVMTSGNSETETFSFKDETTRSWEKSSFRIKAGAIRAESTTVALREAVGTPGSFVIEETKATTTSAEVYYFEGRFDKKIHDKFFWFAGAGWDRNRPAGIDSRTAAFGGVGNIWRDDDKIKFRTDYALSYTDQEDVVPTASSENQYAGLRGSWIYKHQLTESTEYFNDLVVDLNLENSDAWRADMINAIAVAINSKLALKTSLQTLYNNAPPMELLDLVPVSGGIPTGTKIPFELDELDTILSASLVINF
jgi:putative salt-induced outer membrane protein YdiY